MSAQQQDNQNLPSWSIDYSRSVQWDFDSNLQVTNNRIMGPSFKFDQDYSLSTLPSGIGG